MGLLGDIGKVVGGDVGKVLNDAEKTIDQTAKAVGKAVEAGANVAFTSITAPTTVTWALITGNPKAAEDTAKSLVKSTIDAVGAAAEIASTPYYFAADVTRDMDGDGIKIVRGAIAGKLVEINIVPALLAQVGQEHLTDPQAIADAVKTAPLAAILAANLQGAHSVLEPAAHELPKLLRSFLKNHYRDETLDHAKYIVSQFGLTLPEVINGSQAFMGNHAFAVTVGNVIVFSTEPGVSDESLHWWAHEVAHVEQYADLGFDGFARKYVEDYKSIEDAAEAKANTVS